MSGGKHMNPQQLEEYLGYRLKDEELKWGISSPANGSNNRLIDLVNAAYRKSGKQVVVLVDEYDAPMLDAAHEKEQLDELRNIMRNFTVLLNSARQSYVSCSSRESRNFHNLAFSAS